MARFYITICLLSTMALGQENSQGASVVGGLYFLRSDWGSSWVPLSALQITYSPSIQSSVRLDWNAEYYFHKFSYPKSLGIAVPRAGRRHDVALYPSLVLFDFVQLGLGLYYSYRGAVVYYSYYTSSTTTVGPMSLIRAFYQIALIPAIALTDQLALRLGLSFRDQEVDDGTTPIALRVGLTATF